MRKAALTISTAVAFGFMSTLVLVVADAVILGSTAYAGGLGRPCTDQPSNSWKSLDALKAQIEAQGFTIKSASFEKRCADLYVVDSTGKPQELFVDPVTGAIVGRK